MRVEGDTTSLIELTRRYTIRKMGIALRRDGTPRLDGSITAKFVSIGATLTELWVKDKHGKTREVVLGYDNPVSSRLEFRSDM
jgi:hypothetical protein